MSRQSIDWLRLICDAIMRWMNRKRGSGLVVNVGARKENRRLEIRVSELGHGVDGVD